MINHKRSAVVLGLVALLGSIQLVDSGIIKDIFQKVTNTNNQTENTVRQSAPICGNGIFSTPNEGDLSPEIIFITNRQSRSYAPRERGHPRQNEVAQEFRFHTENVSLSELESHGFNPDAPVTFLIHGFTSGYPLQSWMSAIVEAYTIDRETNKNGFEPLSRPDNFGRDRDDESSFEAYENRNRNTRRERQVDLDTDRDEIGRRRRPTDGFNNQRSREFSRSRAQPVEHNLFIVNWNYAARGIVYPRAVANIPIVASYVTNFINNKLIDEAKVDPKRIQLIGHSLGAHLSGYVGKNTKSKLGRIYGLDPAGPCFGTVSGPLYPSSKRLAPSDADEVITIQTNSALLGIERPLGRYSIYVEGGADQPGCKPSGVLKSLGTLTLDGGDTDTVSCSHSRAPNLITYRHDQSDTEDSCLMVAYACKDWESFKMGQCGVCDERADRADESSRRERDDDNRRSPMEPVECLRIGLDWQYPKSRPSSGRRPGRPFDDSSTRRPNWTPDGRSTRRPRPVDRDRRAAKQESQRNDEPGLTRSNSSSSLSSISPYTNSSSGDLSREKDEDVKAVQMFLRTSDTQPYCAFHYQLILELNEPFDEKSPPMAIILQDSEIEHRRGLSSARRKNSLSTDEFGHKFDDKTYTHLLTSYRKLKKINHATLMLRNGLKNGHQVLKALHVNYMSHSDPSVRQRWSSRLCPVRTDTDREAIAGEGANRFYFEPCDRQDGYPSSGFDPI